MEEVEKKREESEKHRELSEEKSRSEFLALKVAVESRMPVVEKRVDDLHVSVVGLQDQVDKLQSLVQQPPRPSPSSPGSPDGMQTPPQFTSLPSALEQSAFASALLGASGIGGNVPPMSCPQFNGDSRQLWKSNCEEYFEVYGVHPKNWVCVAGLNFTGNAAFWLQSVRSKLVGVTWQEFFDQVCLRFTKDRQKVLIRQWFHIVQDSSVSDYVEKFDGIMHQLLAYDSSLPLNYFVTKFVEGLRKDIRSGVLMQKPQDLDTACSLAFLQEEILEGSHPAVYRKPEPILLSKNFARQPAPVSPVSNHPQGSVLEDRKQSEFSQSRSDKFSALKSYKRAKGLCFTCGEHWSREHKCGSSVQLHVVQELLAALQDDQLNHESVDTVSEPVEPVFMAISYQAVTGTESLTSFRLNGWVQGYELLMLVDSGSSHSFIDITVAQKLQGIQCLQHVVSVKVADGGVISCSQYIPGCDWWTQGQIFKTDFKVLPLGCYDIILGMDWLVTLGSMNIDWAAKCMEFARADSLVTIKGIQSQTTHCSCISGDQLQGMFKLGSIMHVLHLQEVSTAKLGHIPPEIQSLLTEFSALFDDPQGLPPKRACDHSIPLKSDAKPVFLKPYRHNPAQKDEIEKQVKEMLLSGVIQPSNSAFSSPALLVKKKDGTWRLCIDYRQLNSITVKGKFPMPVIDELLDELSGSKVFSKLDLRASYHQIRLVEGEEHKTAFQTHSGHYEYRVMSFGLTGAPATFQGAMNDTLAPVLRKFALVFFDDILVCSPDLVSHVHHLRQVLQLLTKHQWKVKLSKCSFAQHQLSYLGHIISDQGVTTDPAKIEEVVN
nr:uncharacterized protein LOC4347143 isoform X1 [Oryza sativa Japonica Group]XP_025875986.1 uncharacterized protein LOC4347143 isoform X1 [Oryza sativa Japonica Group]XP_025875987.1 uncharacterized protein LOC4347143 isoform X1 [Oryza sativa Japonica Group]